MPSWNSDSLTLPTQGNPQSSHRLGLETLRNRGSGGLSTVMTEEAHQFSIPNSCLILNYRRGEAGGNSEFGIRNYRREEGLGLLGRCARDWTRAAGIQNAELEPDSPRVGGSRLRVSLKANGFVRRSRSPDPDLKLPGRAVS